MILLVIVASVLAALAPTVLYTLLVWWADRHEREPLPLLLAVFFWGAVPATAVALILESSGQTIPQVNEGIYRGAILSSALGVPIIEEVVKALALLAVVTLASREFDGVLDGIVYGAVVGFGFAMTENIFYFIGAYGEQGWSWWAAVVGLRAVIFGFNHAVFTACTGIGFGLAVLSRRRAWRWLFPLLGLTAAILLHGLHNLGAELSSVSIVPFLLGTLADWGGFWLLALIVVLTWDQERRWIRVELADEVGVLLRPEEYEAILTFSARAVRRLALLPFWRSSERQRTALFQHRLVDLAFVKARLRRLATSETNQANALRGRADQLRAQITALRPDMTPVKPPLDS